MESHHRGLDKWVKPSEKIIIKIILKDYCGYSGESKLRGREGWNSRQGQDSATCRGKLSIFDSFPFWFFCPEHPC